MLIAIDRSRLPVPGPEPDFKFPQIERQLLGSGLRLWTVEQPGLPMLSLLLLFPAGASADPATRPGLAALTADMLDEGSGNLSAIDIQDALAKMGSELQAEVGPDTTVLALTTLARFRDRALALLADIVARPSLAEGDVERVRELRLNRLTQFRDLPPVLAERAFAELLYPNHPYGHLSIGTATSLRALGADEVRSFHQHVHRPNCATLIAVGDASHQEMRQSAEDAFAAWPGDEPAATPPAGFVGAQAALDDPAPPSTKLALLHRSGAPQSELRIGHVAVSRDTPDYHSLLVLNMVLGGQFVSRVNLNLRERKGYTYGARTSFDFRRGRGPFSFQASVHTAVTADAIREALDELTAVCGPRPVTADELDMARAALTRGYPRRFETVEQIAGGMAQMALHGLPDDYFEQFVPSVAQVNLETVNAVAVKHIDPTKLLTLIVGDRDVVGPSLGALGLGEATILEKEE